MALAARRTVPLAAPLVIEKSSQKLHNKIGTHLLTVLIIVL